jgi:SAM-dependent methyltransferase
MSCADRSGGYTEHPFVARFYDDVIPYRDRPDVGFFVSMARERGAPVLEIGCGTGRVLIPTARAGLDIVGLDLSAEMLRVCRERLTREPDDVQLRVQLVEADMRRFELGRSFRLITIPFRPFQHLLEVSDQISCLRSVHRHLADDGRLVLDVFNPSIPLLAAEQQDWLPEEPFRTREGQQVVRRSRIASRDLARQIVHSEIAYDVTHADGHQEELVHRFEMRYLFRYEAEHLLARCGFALEAVYADYDRASYGSKYPGELILVARKAGGPA